MLQSASCSHVKVTVLARLALQGKLLAQKIHNHLRLLESLFPRQRLDCEQGREGEWASGWEGRKEGGKDVQSSGGCFASEPLICLVLKGGTRSCFYILKLSRAPYATSHF